MGKQQVWSVTACVFLFLSLSSQIHCSKEEDLIKTLPGQPTVDFRQYGGYVTVNETAGQFFYYYFAEAIEAKDSSPLIIWFNGGPGGSSLIGAFTEHGPFRVYSDGKTLYRNPYSWNNKANVLYLETPVGVGFSYTKTPKDVENQPGDKIAADDNYTFLVKWLERFPEYKGREFYVTGQSYAGHYAPLLAQTIVHNQRNKKAVINLRGVMIGNPVIDQEMDDSNGTDEYSINHAFFPKEFTDILAARCSGEYRTLNLTFCDAATRKVGQQTEHIDTYSIYRDVCLNATLTSKPNNEATAMKSDPCCYDYMTAYLNTPNVQEAMHANTTKLTYPWKNSNPDTLNYWSQDDTKNSMLPILQELIGEGIRVWVYSGDADEVVPVTSTIRSIKKMNLTVEKTWRPWFSGQQVGGYTEIYKGNLTFVTVKGAGHSVPADQPIRAFTLFTSFIQNTPLPATI